ncbi:carbonic anhydrase family protein [Rhodoferax saidenbachensis]|uniref:carbonic anhydrase n=1 Tax=Rhodoferax saidenbachensis TaxID=1484693 RepID=A0ABU1ZRW3_9BURK|nr:carbonic anhydrase family protein [Rhodoferax saidenbachensis]MDR7308133.1 carbonic anhydrase [Rhodoferax saidenbachensis]
MPTRSPYFLLLALALGSATVGANDAVPATKPAVAKKPAAVDIQATSASNAKEVGDQLREALGVAPKKKLTITVSGTGPAGAASASRRPPAHAAASQAAKTGAEAHGGEVHWAYEGDVGPQAWGKLKPDFNVCALGKRQSPINIEDGNTLQGPAEPLLFNYTASNGTVLNNGHTIQVDVQGDNTITVRGSRYKLLQFHFHTPSEEQVNGKRAAMVAHLVHKNDDGQLAVVAVLLEPGVANPLIDKVWTYMPLEVNDRVRMPRELLNLNELLPTDQRYYQFMGSLTTPPCTEGVLWTVLKQPMQISRAQYKLFTQLYANNARPVQALNGRPVREAQ